MSASRRVQRVEKELLQIISSYLLTGLKDPLLGVVSVSRVQVSPDLRNARVFLTMLAEEDEVQENLETLAMRGKDVQREISRQLPMKYCPKVSFVEDKGMKKAHKVLDVLQQLRSESKGENS